MARGQADFHSSAGRSPDRDGRSLTQSVRGGPYGRGQGGGPSFGARDNRDPAPLQQQYGSRSNSSSGLPGCIESSAVMSTHDTKAAANDNNNNKFAPAHQQHSKVLVMTNDDAKESPAELAPSLSTGSEVNVSKEGNLAAHEHPTSVPSEPIKEVPVSEEHWNRLSVGDKLALLLPDEVLLWRHWVAEFRTDWQCQVWKNSVAVFPSNWQKRVEEAVSRTLEQTRKEWKDKQNTGSDEIEVEYDTDCEPDEVPNMSGTTCTELPQQYVLFIEKLPQCTAMHLGFVSSLSGVKQEDHTKKCYCPCGKKMRTWRMQFGIEDVVPQCKSNPSYGDSKALAQHLQTPLREKGMLDYHKITYEFLRIMYGLDSLGKQSSKNKRKNSRS